MTFADLPKNAMLAVLLRADYVSLLRMQVASKSWLDVVCGNQRFWKSKFEMDFGGSQGEEEDFEQMYRAEFAAWASKHPKVTHLDKDMGTINMVKVHGSMALCVSFQHIFLWDLQKTERVGMRRLPAQPTSVAFDCVKIVAGFANGDIHLFSAAAGIKPAHKWNAHSQAVRCLCVSADVLVSGGGDDRVKLWDASTCECLKEFPIEKARRVQVVGKDIICTTSTHVVTVVNQAEGVMRGLTIRDLLVYMHDAFVSMFSNRKHLVVGGCFGSVQVWDREGKEHVATLNAGVGPVVALAGDDRKVVSATRQGDIRVWETGAWTCLRAVQLSAHDKIQRMDCDERRIIVNGVGRRDCEFNARFTRVLDFNG